MTEAPVARGYRILQRLGTGGMGTVFIGEKLTTRQQYAIKFLRDDYARDVTYLARFEREINALLAIRHPHVVNVFDWWFPSSGGAGKPFIVMELLDGQGLDERLRGRRSLDPAAAVNVMLQTLDGLSAAHGIGVIHRDLGPSNIFLCPAPNGRSLVKILDFGLARSSTPGDESGSNITSSGTLMGKPGYVAPEMLMDEPVNERSDIFACGMLLYRMLAGRLPFTTTQPQALWIERFADVRQGHEILPLGRYAPAVPRELQAIVERAVRRRPAERYQTVDEMQVELLALELAVPEPPAETSAADTPTGRAPPAPIRRTGEIWIEAPPDDKPIELDTAEVPASAEYSSRAPSVLTGSTSRPGAVSILRAPARYREPKPFPIFTVVVVLVAVLVAAAAAYRFLFWDGGVGPRSDAGGHAHPAPADVTPTPAEPAAHADAGTDAASSPSGPEAGDLVNITVTGVPPGGQVLVANALVPGPPYQRAVPRSQKPVPVVVEALGFVPFRAEAVPTQDVSVVARMRRANPSGSPRRDDTPDRAQDDSPHDEPAAPDASP